MIPRLLTPYQFPRSRKPGIDWQHPAVNGLVISAVAMNNGNMFNLGTPFVGAKAATIGGTPSVGNDQFGLGPLVGFSGSTDKCSFTIPAANYHQTMGSIFVITSHSGGASQTIADTGANGYGMYDGGTGIANIHWGTTNNNAAWTQGGISLNVPYFWAASFVGSTGLGAPNQVLVNMQTGQTYYGWNWGGGGGVPAGGNGGTMTIGNNGSSQQLRGYLAAIMWANTGNVGIPDVVTNTLLVLRQWAEDPWALWYPRRVPNIISIVTAVRKPLGSPKAMIPQCGM